MPTENMDYKTYFKGKKITIMGLGLLGRGLGVARFLADCGSDLLITDLKTADQLASSLVQLEGYKNIKYVLGEHRLQDFQERDLVIKAAGVPLDSIYLAEALANGVPVKMESALFATLTDATLIGVTGTRGKSTVTHFIFESLKKFYKNGGVFLGGNVKGLATLPLLQETKKGDLVVLELDSWQLQGFGEEKVSPHIAVFTNFLEDHLNYYMRGGNSENKAMDLYFADKANIFRNQKKSDYLIVSKEVAPLIIKKYPLLGSQILVVQKNDLPADFEVAIPGAHNRYNLALGVAVLKLLDLNEEEIKTSVKSFAGVPGRLQLVREKDGVKIYNDTTSTTPASCIAALQALGKKTQKNLVLIMGGADKQIDMTKLLSLLPKYCHTIVLLPGSGTDIVREKIKKENPQTFEVASLVEAIQKAVGSAKSGDTVLMSPAFASFGLFQNEFDRGEQFDALVKNLQKPFDLAKVKKVHFVGIGGIGVSAVARMMIHEGKVVSGSDRADSELIGALKASGAAVYIGHKAENVPKNVDLVVYTIAANEDNPELVRAREIGAMILSYPQFVGEISKNKFTIAVSGTHGKTTTTAMIAKILVDAGLDPTVIVGSLIKTATGERTNFVAGRSKYLVIEACEYKRSFLQYHPQILVITNIDNDHLDYYKDVADIQSAFAELAQRVPQEGFVVTDKNNATVVPVLKNVSAKIVNYDLYGDMPFQLKVSGIHNKKNAAAAFAVAVALGVDAKAAADSLSSFAGTWRRFEYKGLTKNGAKVYDDYGHHPTEIKATLQGARQLYPRERLIVAFQPHLYSRTKLLLDDFAGAFKLADEVILAPIYAAREANDGSISSEMLAQKISEKGEFAKSPPSLKEVENYLANNSKKGDVVVVMGAGDIYEVADKIITKSV